ncbi:MAG: hypothetical protein ACLP22_16470 [Solirubrobacteraceae bacterium]
MLATLDRYPAIIGALTLPGSATAQPLYNGYDFRSLVGEGLGPQGLPAFSPDGRQLAVGDSLGPVRLYDAATHTLLATGANDFVAYQPPVYSPDGSLIVYNGSEGDEDLEVRSAQTLRLIASLPVAVVTKPENVPGGNVAIAPDDRTVYFANWENYPATVGLAYIEWWSLPRGRGPTVPIGTESILAMRLIDGGSRLLLIGTRSVSEFDARSLRRMFAVRYASSPVAPTTAAIVPDGHEAAIGTQNGAVWFVDTTTGAAREGSVPQQGGVVSVLDSPLTGAVVTVGAEGGVIVWDPATARPLQILDGPPVQPTAAALSPDGSTLYTAGRDGTLLEWDLAGSRRFGARASIGSASACCSPVSPLAPAFALSPDGSRFAALVGPRTVGVFATATRARLATFTTPAVRGISALAFAPSGQQLGVGGADGAVQLWGVAGRPRVIGSFRISGAVASAPDTVESISFSSSGSLVATSDEANVDGPGTWANGDASTIEMTSAATRALTFVNSSSSTLEGGQPAAGLSARYGEALTAFVPGERSIAATTLEEGYLDIVDATGAVVRQLDVGPNTTALAFAPDRTLAVGTALGTVELWNVSTGNEIGSPLSVSDTPVTSIAFDHTGDRFVTASLGAGSVTLWDTSSLARLGTFATDPDSTSSVGFDAQGDLIAVDTRGASFVWPLSLTAWEHAACAIAGGPVSRAEWAQLRTGLAYTPVCQQ